MTYRIAKSFFIETCFKQELFSTLLQEDLFSNQVRESISMSEKATSIVLAEEIGECAKTVQALLPREASIARMVPHIRAKNQDINLMICI